MVLGYTLKDFGKLFIHGIVSLKRGLPVDRFYLIIENKKIILCDQSSQPFPVPEFFVEVLVHLQRDLHNDRILQGLYGIMGGALFQKTFIIGSKGIFGSKMKRVFLSELIDEINPEQPLHYKINIPADGILSKDNLFFMDFLHFQHTAAVPPFGIIKFYITEHKQPYLLFDIFLHLRIVLNPMAGRA